MPTYEYHCDACEHGFEEFQSITASPLKKCPKCGKRKLRRVFGIGAAVLFKGSGFYQTDYRSDAYKKRAAEDKPKSDGGAKSDGGGEAKKTDAKADSSPAKTKPAPGKPKSE